MTPLTPDERQLIKEILEDAIRIGSGEGGRDERPRPFYPRAGGSNSAPGWMRAPFRRTTARIIKAAMRDYLLLGHAFIEKSHTIHKLLRMIFGAKTEKAEQVDTRSSKKPKGEKPPPRGHGRNGAASYTGGRKVTVSHGLLKSGDACPGCQKGKVYPTAPGVTVRITGDAPLTATSFELREAPLQPLRRGVHRQVPTTGSEKYDATAGAMIALLEVRDGRSLQQARSLQESHGRSPSGIHPVGHRRKNRQARPSCRIRN